MFPFTGCYSHAKGWIGNTDKHSLGGKSVGRSQLETVEVTPQSVEYSGRIFSSGRNDTFAETQRARVNSSSARAYLSRKLASKCHFPSDP